ncbi:MAG: hypothetical protein OXQ92_14960 [Boseongicola sp.]|nr:hypothetical protein [Boseongicola sp.]MDD9977772.1 hypothetical protein [Boseongicola sp.]
MFKTILRDIGRAMLSFVGILVVAFLVGAAAGAYAAFAYSLPLSLIFWGGIIAVILVLAIAILVRMGPGL